MVMFTKNREPSRPVVRSEIFQASTLVCAWRLAAAMSNAAERVCIFIFIA